MDCKYKNHPYPPCQFEQHPHNHNVYFCPHCREWYDVREVGNPFPQWLLFIIALIMMIFVINHPQSFQQRKDNLHTPNAMGVKPNVRYSNPWRIYKHRETGFPEQYLRQNTTP